MFYCSILCHVLRVTFMRALSYELYNYHLSVNIGMLTGTLQE